ncbi:DUF6431 domain-containing protein [Antrihabitans spumae]|uniref:DUF6431 domain-containing protein n=2 Tax=Antrihabitans spumae TaxID=3373370 RepID=A0ABW7KWR5_9NOCA
MIVIRNPADTDSYLSGDGMACPNCAGPLSRWGHGRNRTVRSLGAATTTVRPQRLRCRDCHSTHIVLPAELQPRRADTTEVIATALTHKANGLGHRRIAVVLDRPESTVRRWLRRTTPAHLDWMWRQGARRLIQLAPDVFTSLRYRGNMLHHTLTVLAAAVHWDRTYCGIRDSVWALIGIYTRGRLLTPP